MVRIDKIIYMITCFKSLSKDLEPLQYSKPPKCFKFNPNALLVMKRLGVIPAKNYNETIEKKLLLSVPLGREVFLEDEINSFCKSICCLDTPKCLKCTMSEKCDYYNNKNDWEIKN